MPSRGLERRLARCVAGAAGLTALRDAARQREEAAELRDSFAEAIRAGLIAAGLDPAEASCLNRRREPPAPVPARPPAPPDDPIDLLEAKFARMAARPRDDPPDLKNASMAELFAFYCLAGEESTAPCPPIGGRGPG